jgi:NADPH:quinone reductase-like Zn-dependent oxidoreductase
MKAAFIEKFGGPEVLTYGDLPDPVAGQGQVVVDTVAASVNGADPKVAAGEYKQVTFPIVLGRDFSGVVSAVGSGVQDLRVGDEVFGVLETGRDGTYCEKIAIGAAVIAKKPPGLGHVDAAAVALTGLTAICSVEDTLKVKRGETVLIQGGAGGVASFAIQLAKHLGARVISTASTGNLDYVRSLGADEVIDYRTTDVYSAVRDADVVLDQLGGESPLRSLACLRPDGLLISLLGGGPALVSAADAAGVRVAMMLVEADRGGMAAIAGLVEAGKLRPSIAGTFPLADAAKAHAVGETGHTAGKLVLVVR